MISKFKLAFFTSFLFLVSGMALTAQTQGRPNYNPPQQTEKMLGSIKLVQNIRYGSIPNIATDSTSDRILDLYLPKTEKANELLQVIVFIHGGGFSGGDKSVTELCASLALQGFAVVSINYTLTLKYKKAKEASCSANMAKGLPVNGTFHPLLNEAIKNASADAVMALVWLKSKAKEYALNINKVAICGGSAGSMTALYTAYASNQKVIDIKAVVDFWGGLENANYIKKGAAPLLIYHGDLDASINVEYAYALKRRMDKIGSSKSEIHIMEGKGHAQYKYIVENKIPEISAFLKSNI